MPDRPAPGPALAGLRVLDFSTLLPGPMASLLLARAGADVLKIERPAGGDEMRSYAPPFGAASVDFALLNQGKRSLTLDLKTASGRDRARTLACDADVLIEQFRPGVMDRLGLGAAALAELNPRLVYCSITGWGQTGPLADTAAHDLNYQAETGLLGLTAGSDGAPGVPQALVADIGGGAWPAVINILLALRARDAPGGRGCHLDVSMADNLFPFMYWGLGSGFTGRGWPRPGGALLSGGSPRYNVYRTSDGRWLAAAPLEQRFWQAFLDVLEAAHLVDDRPNPEATRAAVAAIIGTRPADEWMRRFDGIDACVSVVRTLEEAVQHPQFAVRGLFAYALGDGHGAQIPALPLPVDEVLRAPPSPHYPAHGEMDADWLPRG
jgi:crotonobetainyl-CoA:carnitine CoA-transferase CaiB-like acyl-CoA transferase